MLNYSLSEGFGQLKSLTSLDLGGSYRNSMRLESLPEGTSSSLSTPTIDRDISSSVLLNRPLSEGFGDLPSLVDLDLGYCHALAKNEGTYAILSKISTLTKLSLANCDMKSLPEGSPP